MFGLKIFACHFKADTFMFSAHTLSRPADFRNGRFERSFVDFEHSRGFRVRFSEAIKQLPTKFCAGSAGFDCKYKHRDFKVYKKEHRAEIDVHLQGGPGAPRTAACPVGWQGCRLWRPNFDPASNASIPPFCPEGPLGSAIYRARISLPAGRVRTRDRSSKAN